MSDFETALLFIAGVFALIVFFSSWFTVKQQTIAIVERFGRFVRTAQPGLRLKVPLIEKIVARMSLRVTQLVVEVETKTKDNVFVKLFVAVQYRVILGREADAYYKLADHVEQIVPTCWTWCARACPRWTWTKCSRRRTTWAIRCAPSWMNP